MASRPITDLTNLTPGLSYTAGNERVTLRGIGRNTNNFGAEPGVANYTDGIYQSFASIAGRDNLFVDRIEVLRGPQGTLYGRNSIGGALNIISKRPTDDFEGEFRLGFGNYDSAKAGFSLSGTIIEDWLRGRVVGFKEARNEGVFNNYGTGDTEGYNINNWNGEVQFEGDIGDRFSWWTKYTTGRYDSAGPPGGRTTPNSNAPYDKNSFGSLTGTGAINPNPYWALGTDPRVLGYTMVGTTTQNPALTDPLSVNDQLKRNAKLNAYDDFALEATYDFDDFAVKYLGGYIYYNYLLTGDQDGSPITSITLQLARERRACRDRRDRIVGSHDLSGPAPQLQREPRFLLERDQLHLDERQPAAVDRWSLCLPGELRAARYDVPPERTARLGAGVRAQRILHSDRPRRSEPGPRLELHEQQGPQQLVWRLHPDRLAVRG